MTSDTVTSSAGHASREGHDAAPEPDSLDKAILWDFGDNHQLELMIADSRWSTLIDDDLKSDVKKLVQFVSALLEASAFTACLRFTHDQEMQTLNAQFRQKDKATNVLSFPDHDGEEGAIIRLGDLAFGFETMKQESEEMVISLSDHLRHLIIHGLLHLIGCDHETDDDAEEMEGLEIAALTVIGVGNPYLGELV